MLVKLTPNLPICGTTELLKHVWNVLMANGETKQVVLVITVQPMISLIPKSKCALTVLMDSSITILPIAVVYVHYTKSIKELVEKETMMVHLTVIVERIVLISKTVSSGILPQTCV